MKRKKSAMGLDERRLAKDGKLASKGYNMQNVTCARI